MNRNEYLFPRRLTRRDFLASTATTTALLAVHGLAQAQENKVEWLDFGRARKFKHTPQA